MTNSICTSCRIYLVCLCVVAFVTSVTFWGDCAEAQDPFFNPSFEPTPTPKPPGAPPVFSFGRFQPSLSAICAEMERDGRRERLFQVAAGEAETERNCISCRSLWRTVVAACGQRRKLMKTKTDVPKAEGTEGEGDQDSSATGVDGDEGSTPTPPPSDLGRERYPSTALLDLTSRLSSEAYDVDPGDRQISQAFKHLASTVIATKDLTPAERTYFEIFTAYLLAAWQGRVDPTLKPLPTPNVPLNEIFPEG